MTDPATVDPLLVLLGIVGLVLAGGGAALFRLLRPAPSPPPRPVGPTPLERDSREAEAAKKAALDKAHAEAVAEKVEIDKMPKGPERTKATGDWWEKRRKRGGRATGPVLLGVVVVVSIAILLAGCLPKTAPPVYSLALPPIPAEVLLVPAPPTLAEDACDALALIPGSPLPPELLGVALRGAPTAACRGIVADENELLAAAQAEADRERLIGYLVAERDGRLGDHVIAEARAAADWTYILALRADNRVKAWTGIGLGLAGFLTGVGLTLAGVQLGAAVAP